jgi:hypothetical protein
VIPVSYLPDYVERGGQQVWRPPYCANQVELYGFVVQADRAAIDSLVLRDLVLPTGHTLDYRCAHPNVIITFGQIAEEASLDPVDKRRGYLAEREVSIWCLVADMNAPGRLVWYLPYIFTDSEQTIATGREIFGYPKQLGRFDEDYPAGLARDGGTTTIRSLTIDPFSPTSQATYRDVLSVTRKPGARQLDRQETIAAELPLLFPGGFATDTARPSGPALRPSASIRSADAPPPRSARAHRPWLKGVVGAMRGKALRGDAAQLITGLIDNPTLVFLKQFRDVACASKACYQAVVEAPLAFHTVGASYQPLAPEAFELTINNYASEPIADELGVDSSKPVPVEYAFHANFGFDIQLGLEVWRAAI